MKTVQIIVLLCLASIAVSEHYFNSQSYINLTAEEKYKLLLNEILKDQTPQGYFSGFTNAGLLLQDNWPTMTWLGDVLPEGRKKLIHSEGVIAGCEINFKNSGYSGVFSENLKYNFIRFSAASAYDTSKSTAEGAFNNFTPGIALKVLESHRPSVNLVAMYDTTFQGSWSPFEHVFSNMFDVYEKTPFAKQLVARAFSKITNNISSVGLKEWAQYTSDGNRVPEKKVKYPFRLFFKPTKVVIELFKKQFTQDYKTILKTIKPGTVIYEIEAEEYPGCQTKKIGEIVLRMLFTTSHFADRLMFFRHLLVDDDDMGEHINNKKFRDYYGFFGLSKKEDSRGKCPFSH